MRELDEAEFRRAGDPAAVDLLLSHAPELDESGGFPALRELGRRALDALGPVTLPDGVLHEVLPGPGSTTLRVFRPQEPVSQGTAVLWIHGGGLVAGVPEQDDALCAEMSSLHGCPVVAPSYGLAPEEPFPRGLEDCYAALAWLLDSGFDARRVVLAGASAGGGLALSLALLARHRGITAICGLLLHYPMLDDRAGRPSTDRVGLRRTWHRDINRTAWDAYLSQVQGDTPYLAAPGRAEVDDLVGLPPVYLDVGTLDAFLNEDLELARRLALAGVRVDLLVTAGAFHASELIAPAAPTSARILTARREAMQRLVAGAF